MLERLKISGYQRIADADLDLTGADVHVFGGDNEAGKTSLLEAVAFCLRGLSPRVKKKGQYDELLFHGKKNGNVEMVMDGFTIERNIKTGKLATAAPLDYPELLVDIQLGRESFGYSDQKLLRQMMSWLFKVEGNRDYVKSRLLARGVSAPMVDRVLPLLSTGGFAAASEAAKQKESEARGKWEYVTGTKFGAVKAVGWEPQELSIFRPANEEDIAAASADIATKKAAYDGATKRLAVLEAQAAAADDAASVEGSLDELKQQERDAQAAAEAAAATVGQLRDGQEKAIAKLTEESEHLTAQIQAARMSAAVLECPACSTALVMHGTQLQKAERQPERSGPSLAAWQESLDANRTAKQKTVNEYQAKIMQANADLVKAQQEAARATACRKLREAQPDRSVTPDEVSSASAQAVEANEALEAARSKLLKLQNDTDAHKAAVKKRDEATDLLGQTQQWGLISDLLSNKPDSIPSELVQRTITPFNEALLEVGRFWGGLPVVLDSSMELRRGDGSKYYMLSESAAWRMEVAVRLALATVSPLKLVAIDRFDVLRADYRGEFVDMLERFTAAHPGITVLVTGTLKSKPVFGDTIKGWWIEAGVIS